MNFEKGGTELINNIDVRNLISENGKDGLIKELVSGLTAVKPYISSKFFYNDRGSELFEQITGLEEYYPSRIEKDILGRYGNDLFNNTKARNIIELGSGDCSKISLLLEAIPGEKLSEFTYVPVDVSKAAILKSAEKIVESFPDLGVEGYILDFTTHFNELPSGDGSIICFFGSTIGNFDQNESLELVKSISSSMSKDDTLLIGFDRIKDIDVLNAAYNDLSGITEIFNKNILSVVNSIIDSDFEADDFEHFAFFNRTHSRIEMHLEARRDITVHSPKFEQDLIIRKGERIHTENSYKYSSRMINELAKAANLKVYKEYSDSRNWFSLVVFSKSQR